MKSPAKFAVLLLPFFLTSCFHRRQAQVHPLAPPIVNNPAVQPSTAPVSLPPQVASIPPEPIQNIPTPPKPKPRRHRSRTSNPPPAAAAEDAANPAPNPGVSAIGQLSSGDPASYRQDTAKLIDSTERGLNGITRPLSDAEQKTAAQIREFIKQARVALASGDMDGAHTLAAKASVLLKELTE
jgi:hypothetical protein